MALTLATTGSIQTGSDLGDAFLWNCADRPLGIQPRHAGGRLAGTGQLPGRVKIGLKIGIRSFLEGKMNGHRSFTKANARADRVRVVYLSFLSLGSSSITSFPLNGS